MDAEKEDKVIVGQSRDTGFQATVVDKQKEEKDAETAIIKHLQKQEEEDATGEHRKRSEPKATAMKENGVATSSMSPTSPTDKEEFNILDVVEARSSGELNEIENESLKKKEAAARAKTKYETSESLQAIPRRTMMMTPVAVPGGGADSPHQQQEAVSDHFDIMEVVQKRAIMANEDIEGPFHQSTVTPGRQNTQPGAYSGTPGHALCRRDDSRFSLIGVQPDPEGVPTVTTEDLSIWESAAMAAGPAAPHSNLPPDDNAMAQGIEEGGLAQAIPVEDEEQPVAEARPFDLEGAKKEEAKKRRKYLLVFSFLFVAVIVGVLLLKKKIDSGRTPSPTLAPSEIPSSAPSGALDILRGALPVHALKSLQVANTPQWKAWEWLENHPELSGMEEGRKLQLFALATYYFAFDGENWNQLIQERWMNYEKEECLWFSSAFGRFNSEGEYYEGGPPFSKQVPSCNAGKEFTSLYLQDLQLAGLLPSIPPEIALLTSLSTISLIRCDINASLAEMLPSELAQLTTLTRIELDGNALHGRIGSELGMMNSLANIHIYGNSLTGTIPSEVGRMSALADLQLSGNTLTGSLPTEVGLMTNLTKLFLFGNRLTGSIPSEIGLTTKLEQLPLHVNGLTGAVPSELGSLVNVTRLYLHTNWLSGSLPSELAMLKNMLHLRLENNSLTGQIPLEFESLRVNGSLKALTLANNSFSGVVPEGLCSLGLFDSSLQMGLSFDCGDLLCGCCWCPCAGIKYGAGCETRAFVPSRDDSLWPGKFPVQLNGTNTITINVRTNDIPRNYAFEWNLLTGPDTWVMLDFRTWGDSPEDANSLHSYNYEVVSDAVYRLHLFDKYDDDKPMCCTYGFGWFAITSAVPSDEWKEGTVIWEAAGDSLLTSLDVFVWVDKSGVAHHVEYLPGERHSVIHNEPLSEHPIDLLPDNVTNDSIYMLDNGSSSSMVLDHEG